MRLQWRNPKFYRMSSSPRPMPKARKRSDANKRRCIRFSGSDADSAPAIYLASCANARPRSYIHQMDSSRYSASGARIVSCTQRFKLRTGWACHLGHSSRPPRCLRQHHSESVGGVPLSLRYGVWTCDGIDVAAFASNGLKAHAALIGGQQ